MIHTTWADPDDPFSYHGFCEQVTHRFIWLWSHLEIAIYFAMGHMEIHNGEVFLWASSVGLNSQQAPDLLLSIHNLFSRGIPGAHSRGMCVCVLGKGVLGKDALCCAPWAQSTQMFRGKEKALEGCSFFSLLLPLLISLEGTSEEGATPWRGASSSRGLVFSICRCPTVLAPISQPCELPKVQVCFTFVL